MPALNPPVSLKIAIDFDGTIVEHKYPKIGNEIPFAIHTLKALQKKGHKLILWTYRSGAELQEALQFCNSRGLEFYAVNKTYPEEKMDDNTSRKILADYYIDDRNFGGLPEWPEIYYQLHPEDRNLQQLPTKKFWWNRK